jgi:hypothetical protein
VLRGPTRDVRFDSMDEWTHITRTEVEVRGVNQQYSGLLDVDVQLSESPPTEWTQTFDHPPNVGIPISMHPPRLRGATIRITPPDSELEMYLDHIDKRIEAVNRWYADNVWPKVLAAGERTKAEAADEAQRVEEARRRLDEL